MDQFNLDSIKEELQKQHDEEERKKQNAGKEKGKNNRFLYLRDDVTIKFRLLPSHQKANGIPYYRILKHSFAHPVLTFGNDKTWRTYYCYNFLYDDGKKCPLCARYDEIYEQYGWEKALHSGYKVQENYLYNVFDYDASTCKVMYSTPQLHTLLLSYILKYQEKFNVGVEDIKEGAIFEVKQYKIEKGKYKLKEYDIKLTSKVLLGDDYAQTLEVKYLPNIILKNNYDELKRVVAGEDVNRERIMSLYESNKNDMSFNYGANKNEEPKKEVEVEVKTQNKGALPNIDINSGNKKDKDEADELKKKLDSINLD